MGLKFFYYEEILTTAIYIATMLTFISCGEKATGPAAEVLSKKTFSKVIAKYDEINDFYDGVAVVELDYKCGLINNKGQEVVPCTYNHIYNSSCGMVQYRDDIGRGFMNTKGQIIVPSDKYSDVEDFSDNLACVRKDGKWGYIDTKGNEVLPCSFGRTYPFSEGLGLVYKDGVYGYVNTKAEFVITPSYDDGEQFSCGVAITEKGDKQYVINTAGEVIFFLDGKTSEFLADNFTDNLIPVIKANPLPCVGFMNTQGKEVIPFEYQYATDFCDGIALAMKDYKIYKINTEGEVLGEINDPTIILAFLDDAEYYCEFSPKILINLLGEELFNEEFGDDWD